VHPLIFRLLEANRALGFRRVLWIILRWLVRKEYFALVRDLRLPIPDVPSHPPMRWTILTGAEIPTVSAINPLMSKDEIRRRWEEGQECFLCWIGSSLVHFRWETTKPAYLPYLDKTLQLLKDDLLVSDVFTHPTFRGSGIHSVSSYMGLRRSRDRGFARSIAIVAWWNAPSLRVTWQKAGYAVAGTVGYWNIGPWRYYFVSGNVWLGEDDSIYIRYGNKESNIDQPMSRSDISKEIP
jgi:hypothetical protein